MGISNEINSGHRVLHSSEDLHASELMKDVLSESHNVPSNAVIFLVGKGNDGSEQLSELASSGKLPKTFAKYNGATGVYHHVSGLESTGSVVKEANRVIDQKNRVLEVSLDEFNSNLSSLDGPVEVEIDSNGTPTSTSSNKKVSPVVLGGIRSIEEVKHERFLINKRRMLVVEENGNKVMDSRRRRLEEEDGDANDDAAQANANDDLTGVYYVAMTPNTFSGLLFFFMFIFVAYTGITCIGDIQGGDTFTDKYPSLGREA